MLFLSFFFNNDNQAVREKERERQRRKPLISIKGVRLFTLGCCQKRKRDNDDDDNDAVAAVDSRQRCIMNLVYEYVFLMIMQSEISFV